MYALSLNVHKLRLMIGQGIGECVVAFRRPVNASFDCEQRRQQQSPRSASVHRAPCQSSSISNAIHGACVVDAFEARVIKSMSEVVVVMVSMALKTSHLLLVLFQWITARASHHRETVVAATTHRRLVGEIETIQNKARSMIRQTPLLLLLLAEQPICGRTNALMPRNMDSAGN